METLLDYPPTTVVPAALPPRPHLANRPNWLWWLFLVGVAALSCIGPTSFYH